MGSTASTFSATLVDEWVRAWVTDAVVCPGSRSSPLALALERDGRIRVWVRLDERSAAYFALGLGLWSGRPAVVVTTSGTAAAELHPAVLEAHHARVPLICCTADRPPELHQVGAPQTIEQAGLFGRAVSFFVDAGVPDELNRTAWRSLGSRIVAEAVHGPGGPGPVHVNLPFREPLIGDPGELPPARPDGAPWHEVTPRHGQAASPEMLRAVREHLSPDRRGLIVAGAGAGDPASLLAAAAALSWPIVADPRSGCRLAGEAALGATVVAGADALLRCEDWLGGHEPEVVLRAGDPPASKVLAEWLAGTAARGAVHVAADPYWAWKDPGRQAAVVVPVRADNLLSSLELDVEPAGEWACSWAEAEAAAQVAIEQSLAGHEEVSEPLVARRVHAAAEGRALVVSSSMPVRDVEWFAAPARSPVRVLSNRGANGIDGVVSTTFGVAAGAGAPVLGLVGDLALLHDASALVAPPHLEGPVPAVVVVVDNQGGGIFSFLPQASVLGEASFERLFGTPQRVDPAALVAACGYEVASVTRANELEGALAAALDGAGRSGEPVFVVVRTERRANVALHAELEAAVARALG